MTSLSVTTTEGVRIDNELFGGNIIFNRTERHEIGESYEQTIDSLGVTILRYPGGSVTEHFFDINDPNKTVAEHTDTGEVANVIPLTEFLGFSEINGHEVNLVLPTRHYLSNQTDENGNRYANVEEEELRTFVRDVVSGEYGGATIRTLEIGNEYWHSGLMNAVEYGRVASDMINIIDNELALLSEDFSEAADIRIGVQMGLDYQFGNISNEQEGIAPGDVIAQLENDYGYTFSPDVYWGSGEVNFHHIVNHMIISELQAGGAFEKADGVIAHVYTYDNDISRTFALTQLDQTWQSFDKEFEIYATEWNLKGVTDQLTPGEDYGLNSANEILNIIETFASFEVDSANVWPLIQSTDNALLHEIGGGGVSPSGAIFSWLSAALPGKIMLDFNPYETHSTEADFGDYKVHGFADPKELIFYIASEHKEGVLDIELDLNELISAYSAVTIDILGVEEGSKPFSNRSDAEIESLDPTGVFVENTLSVPLDPGEIIQIKIQDYEATDALASIVDDEFNLTQIDEGEIEPPLAEIDTPEPGDDDLSDIEESADWGDGLAILIGLIPILALLAIK